MILKQIITALILLITLAMLIAWTGRIIKMIFKKDNLIGIHVKYSEETAKNNFKMVDDYFNSELMKISKEFGKRKEKIKKNMIAIPLDKVYINGKKIDYYKHHCNNPYDFMDYIYYDGDDELGVALDLTIGYNREVSCNLTPKYLLKLQDEFEKSKKELIEIGKKIEKIEKEYEYFLKKFR